MDEIKNLLPNVNVNSPNSSSSNVNVKQLTEVREIAHKLCEQLADSQSYEFFCGVAWHLPEHVIWNNLEMAQKGRSPKRLFTWLCKQSMKKAPASR